MAKKPSPKLKHVLALTIWTDAPVASKAMRDVVRAQLLDIDVGLAATITRVGLRPLDTDK